MTDANDLPVWARTDAFAPAGPGEWGWVDRKGRRFPCESFHALEESIIKDANAQADLVWTPASPNLVIPEEIPELLPSLREAKLRWAQWEITEGKRQMIFFGIATLVLLGWYLSQGKLSLLTLGLGVALFLFLGFFPWHRGLKRAKNARLWAAGEMANDAPVFRFEAWIDHQKAPFARALLILISAVGISQLLAAFIHPHGIHSIEAAGLTKVNGKAADWWRLFTGPLLHGNLIHFFMNASALVYLAKRVECFARWPHLLFVFLFSAWLGGEASARFVAAPSVGASGGLMGLLGFLMVFETMHPALVPESARHRLLLGIVLTALLGAALPRIVDNYAHAGGLLAGMLYAVAIFPKSSSAHRPSSTPVDFVLGSFAAVVLALSGLFAIWQVLTVG